MKVCLLCGTEHDLVLGEWCDSCSKAALAQLAQMELSDELSDWVIRIAEFAVEHKRIVDKESIDRSLHRLHSATGAATTRARAIEVAAVTLVYALQIPQRGHSIREEDRARALAEARKRGKANNAGRDRWMRIAEEKMRNGA